MLVISHRGDSRQCRQNTIEAFQAALALGVDGIETDLRLTRDGKVVLFHDRLCGETPVEALSHAELSAAAGFEIALANEALERFQGIFWNLEMKTPSVVEPSVDLIGRLLGQQQLLVTSFWHNAVADVRERLDVPCGLLVCHRPLDGAELDGWRAQGIDAVVWDFEFLDEAMLAHARGAGLRSFAYNVQTRADHERAKTSILDGVITDYPEYL